MTIRKKGDAQKLEVLRGKEAQVLHTHMQRTGKYQLSDFTEEEMATLREELERAREAEETEQKEARKLLDAQKKAEQSEDAEKDSE